MSKFKFRIVAEIVAVAQLIIASASFVLFLAYVVRSTIFTIKFVDSRTSEPAWYNDTCKSIENIIQYIEPKWIPEHTIWVLWIYTAAFGICDLLDLIAGSKLLRSTKQSYDTLKRLRLARFWSSSTTVLAVITAARMTYNRIWYPLAGRLAIRIVSLMIGWQYVRELTVAVAASSTTDLPMRNKNT